MRVCAGMVRRKVLVLDLDETLIHSHHDGIVRPMVKPGTPPDFVLKVCFATFFTQLCFCTGCHRQTSGAIFCAQTAACRLFSASGKDGF